MAKIQNIALGLIPFTAMIILWELVVNFGGFPPKLTPSTLQISEAFIRLIHDGIIFKSLISTLYRLFCGFLIASVCGICIGLIMGRIQFVEDLLLPIVSFIYPIPGIAYAPLFVLWFGLGDFPTILLISFAASFPIIFNAWKGVSNLKAIWIRSSQVMGASNTTIFYKVILPGALPFILTGLRLGLATAWRILVAVELFMSVNSGLGMLIFGSQTFLNIDVMLSAIIVIGISGYVLEKIIFGYIEKCTVIKWGMVQK